VYSIWRVEHLLYINSNVYMEGHMPIIHVNVRLYHLINITGVEAASDGYQLACTVTLEYRQQLCKP